MAALAGLLLWNEHQSATRPSGPRFRALFGRALPFLAGAAVPLAAYAALFAAQGALPELLNGVFVLPMLRLDNAAKPPPAVWVTLASALLPLAALALPARTRLRPPIVGLAAVALAALLFAAGEMPRVYATTFIAARAAIPFAAVAGAVLLARAGAEIPAGRRVEVFAVLVGYRLPR